MLQFAGRQALKTKYTPVLYKQAMYQQHDNGETHLACGLACSEIFSGSNLARMLEPSHRLEAQALVELTKGNPAPTLSLHTSAGVNPALPSFLSSLEPHLPASFINTGDSFVSLQVSGADAVWAAADLLLQLQQVRGNIEKTKVACAEYSYHGPGTSAFGRSNPLGSKTPLQVTYPAPSIFARKKNEDNETEFQNRKLIEFETFLDSNEGHQVGVLLIEPQSGSSCIAQPWNPNLLKKYVSCAKERGILVCSDEIMCGLGRHGQGTTFCSDKWNLDVDALTFGKSIACGIEPLAGVAVRSGAEELGSAGKSVLQSHTYAGASTRALTTGKAVLDEIKLGGWLEKASEVGNRVIAPMFDEISEASNGLLGVQGQGFMWGGVFCHHERDERRNALNIFRKECKKEKVLPYFVPESGGFMFTPMMDADVAELLECGKRLAQAVDRTSQLLIKDHNWCSVNEKNPFMGIASPVISASPPSFPTIDSKKSKIDRYKGPQIGDTPMTPRQSEIYEAISLNRSTGVAGPFGPWLINPDFAQHAQMLGKTCRYDLESYDLRESEMVILMVAIATNAPTEWEIHVHEAEKAGLEEDIIHAIREYGSRLPEKIKKQMTMKDLSIVEFTHDLLTTNGVSDKNYTQLQKNFGDLGCVELVGLVGYYGLVSMTLNTFDIQP
jgi:adenosylmethionine-8-amino-7-oxononanoate aminotransferase